MNQLKAYEITIKGKLEAIPLPGMEDGIWARIEAQLDTDMPTDDGNSGPFDSPTGPLILGSSILVFLITLLTLYFSQKVSDNSSAGTENQNSTFQNSATGVDASPPGSNSAGQFVSPDNSPGDLPVNEPSSSGPQSNDLFSNGPQSNDLLSNGVSSNDPSSIGNGSEVNQNGSSDSSSLSDLQNSSNAGTNLFPPVVQVPTDKTQTQKGIGLPPPKDSVVTGKKSRGVKGVTDNDYRIVPKKDN